jgi:hypothetical protein
MCTNVLRTDGRNCLISCLTLMRHLINRCCNFVTVSYGIITYSFHFVSQSFPLLPTHSRCRGCLFSLDHAQIHTTVGRTPLDEGSACRRDLYLTTQTLYKRQTSMSLVGFEPTIPASARPQTYTLDRAATGIGIIIDSGPNLSNRCWGKDIVWAQFVLHMQKEPTLQSSE